VTSYTIGSAEKDPSKRHKRKGWGRVGEGFGQGVNDLKLMRNQGNNESHLNLIEL